MAYYGESKTCPKCGREKPLEYFYKRNFLVGTPSGYCKKCQRDIMRQYRKAKKFSSAIAPLYSSAV